MTSQLNGSEKAIKDQIIVSVSHHLLQKIYVYTHTPWLKSNNVCMVPVFMTGHAIISLLGLSRIYLTVAQIHLQINTGWAGQIQG
jgi:hypothetical protein